MKTRPANPSDAAAIAKIYNQGIAERIATFETQPRTAADITAWFDPEHAVVVVEDGEEVMAFAATYPYRARACYEGVREFSVYVERSARGKGAGRLAMQELIRQSRNQGRWKLLSRVFPENAASLGLLHSLGFRDVGSYERHAQLDGEWRDVVIVELLI